MNDDDSEKKESAAGLGRQRRRIRRWVQSGFLLIWLAPLGRWFHGVPGCVFHCYSCPLSMFGCPIGVAANYAAMFPATFEVPYLLLGVLLLTGAAVGSLACGWACPFGLFQDLLAKVFDFKFQPPAWTGYGRYIVLIGLVVALPMAWGHRSVAYEEQPISVCRLCPAGALEAGLPYSIRSLMAGQGWLMSGLKCGVLLAFVSSALLIQRPWCRMFCPLGGLLALFNRWSFFHLQFNP